MELKRGQIVSKKLNASGEKEMKAHIRDITAARKVMIRQTGDLKKSISTKIRKGLAQDRRVLKDMKKADKRK